MGYVVSEANRLLDDLLCTSQRSQSEAIKQAWLGLSLTVPETDGSSFTEPQYATGYARILIGSNDRLLSRKMSTPLTGTSENTIDLNFPPCISVYGPIVYLGIFRERTGGTPLYIAPLTTSVSAQEGRSLTFRTGALRFSLL